MNSRSLRALLAPAALVCTVLTTGARAVPAEDPVVLLRTATDEVLRLAYEASQDTAGAPLSARVRPVLEKYFAFDVITRRAVGPGWRQFTPEHQQRVIELFAARVLRTYVDRFEVTDEKPVVSYGTAAAVAENRREVPSTITYRGSKFAVAYRFEDIGGQWRIYDVVIEGVSMIANYRAQFDPLVRRGGAPAVIESLLVEPAPKS